MVSDRDSWSFGGIYDHIQKPQDVAVFDKPAKLFFQNVVIDTVKILSNIAFQDPAVRPVLSVVPRHKIFQAVKSEVRSFAFLACVVVVYESFRKVRFQDIIAKTVLNDFVAEAVIHDQPFFRFFHNEAVIRRQAVFVGR